MDSEGIVQRANAVARFFEAMPDRQQAIDGVAAHFLRYWAPSLREELLAQAQAQGKQAQQGLHPLVRAALLERLAAR
jgi:formate dehydrogenase subunit delta